MHFQEVQAAAALAVKDLAANERQEIALQERRKHADGKAKKYRKSLKEVSFFFELFHCPKFTKYNRMGPQGKPLSIPSKIPLLKSRVRRESMMNTRSPWAKRRKSWKASKIA